MRVVFVYLAVAGLGGCHNTPSRVARTSVPAAAQPSSDTPDDDGWCKGDTTVFAHPDPGKLVREYVARDATGEFLSFGPFWRSATECAGEGTDGAAVVASYSIDSLGITRDTARFVVTYRFLGDLVQSALRGFEPRVSTTVDTFVVIHRPYGWRIVGEHDLPTLDVNGAKTHWPLTPADLHSLDSAEKVSASRRGA